MGTPSYAEPSFVFIHDALDSTDVWDDVVAALGEHATGALCVGIAQDIATEVQQLALPVVLVGHGKAVQAAELVALLVADQLRGLVLLAPVPSDLDEEKSRVTAPVLIVRGEHDDLVTEDLVAQKVAPRFDRPARACIGNAGHCPHVEQPGAVAGVLASFLESLDALGPAP